MKELELIEELEKIINDDKYARKILELSEQDSQYIFETYKTEKISELKAKIEIYKLWNTTSKSGVPLRFQNCNFDNFISSNISEEKRKQKVINFIDMENNDGILLMTGDKGTGKTHLGAAAVRATLGHYVTMEDLIYRVESSLNFKSQKEFKNEKK